MAQTQIVLNRQSDLTLDNALITNPQGIVLTDISGVSEAVASINEATSVAISSEASDRVVGDLSLASDLSTELVDRAAAVSAEASLRVAGDDSLQGQIDVEVDARASAVSAEASDRVVGDLSLASKLSAEASVRIVAETSLQNNIDAEASTGLVRDNAEASMARAAEQSLATDLLAEQARAESAELSLNTKVEFVISNTSDTALDSLTEIVAAFQSADGDINGAITTLGSAATVAVDNEASIRLAADQSLAGDLSSEIADREAAVSLEEAARIAGDSSLELELSAEIEARVSDVDAEQARAESAEASLVAAKLDLAGGTMSGAIDMGNSSINNANQVNAATIVTDAIDGLTGPVIVYSQLNFRGFTLIKELGSPTDSGDAANKQYVDDANYGLSAELSAEVSARLDAGTSVSAELSSAVSNINDDIETQQSARVAADESLASEIESLAITDETTIELNTADNTIKLKDTIAAPASGVRTFEGEVDVNSILRVAGVDVMAAMSTEVSDRIVGDESLAAAKLDLAGGTMSGVIDMNGYDMNNVGTITVNTSLYSPNDLILSTNTGRIWVPNSNLDLNDNNKVINLASPTNGGDAANKQYVDDADASIMTIVNNVISNTSEDALDSLTEIVAAFQSADGDLNGAITALASTGTSGLSAEILRAESAEASLAAAKLDLSGGTMSGVINMGGSNIDAVNTITTNTLYSANDLLLTSNNGRIWIPNSNLDLDNNGKVINLPAPTNGGDAANKTYVDAADASIAAVLSTEVSDRIADVDAEESRAVAAEGSLAAILSSEVARAEAAELSLAEELSSEVSYLISNIDVTQIDSFSEMVGELSSEILRAESAEASLDVAKLNLSGGTMTGTIEMSNNSLYNASEVTAVHVETNTLMSKGGINSSIDLYANLDARSVKSIINLPAPTNDGDAANKLYVDSEVSTEVARAEAAEASIALDFANVYAKHVALTQTANGVVTVFSLVDVVREGSELIYVNGLLLDSEDYTANITNGMVSSVTFFIAPSTGDKVRAYGVY